MKEILLERNKSILDKTKNVEKYNLIHSIISSTKWPDQTPTEVILSILVDLEYSDQEIEELYKKIIHTN